MGSFAINLNKLAKFIWKLIALNIFWLLGVIIGVVIFGIGPATTALCATFTNDMRNKNDNLKVSCNYFWKYYKENFIRTCRLFLPIIVLSYFIFLSNQFINNIKFSGNILLDLTLIFSMVILLSLIIFLPTLYVYYHYDEIYKYFILSIILIIKRCHITILSLIIPYLVLRMIGLIFPGLILLLGVTLNYYITNKIIYKDLKKIL